MEFDKLEQKEIIPLKIDSARVEFNEAVIFDGEFWCDVSDEFDLRFCPFEDRDPAESRKRREQVIRRSTASQNGFFAIKRVLERIEK